jgi:hypothetical protein
MKTKLLFSIFGVVVLLFAAGTASAQPQLDVSSTSFTYQGRLMDGSTAADGAYDFQFSLYSAESGGTQVGSTLTQGDVTVTDGLFTVQLDFGSVFNGSVRYLEIAVRPGASEDAYTTLSPRQPLTAAPFALYSVAAPWSGLTGVPAGFADNVDNDTVFGAGTGLTLEGLTFNVDTAAIQQRVSGSCAVGNAIRVIGADGTVTCQAGGNGTVTSVGTSGGLTGGPITGAGTISISTGGVTSAMIADATIAFADLGQNACTTGQSPKWDGVGWACAADSAHSHWGQSWTGSGTGLSLSGGTYGVSGSGSTYGVYGYGAPTGVKGEGTTNGVEGTGSSYGVYGHNAPTGVRGEGTVYGVNGYSSSVGGMGIYGQSSGTSGTGVYGYATDAAGTGVLGRGTTAVKGESNVAGGTGVYGTGTSGAVAFGVSGYTTTGTGVKGESTAASGIGVEGKGHTGVYGHGGSIGIEGSGTQYGVYGYGSPTGVQGDGDTYGVAGSSTSGAGVAVYGYAMGASGRGVHGYATGASGTGVYGNGATAVKGVSSTDGGKAIHGVADEGAGSDYAGYFDGNIQVNGAITATGSITGLSKSAVVDTQDYGARILYSQESPENWFEDFGTGQLVNGAAVITIEPVFAETVNLSEDYHVFLTPRGDCPLYVDELSPASFSVRATGGQTCSIAFDYRIVAKRLGFENLRLAEADTSEPTQAGER